MANVLNEQKLAEIGKVECEEVLSNPDSWLEPIPEAISIRFGTASEGMRRTGGSKEMSGAADSAPTSSPRPITA
jgi:hypothetical protein